MNKTKNYGLPIYERGDLSALISGYDVAIEIIDTILFKFDGEIEALEEAIKAINVRLGDVENRLDKLEKWQADMNEWKKQVTVWQTKIDTRINADNTTLEQLLNKIYGGATINKDGSINWGVKSGKIPVGDLNIFSGIASPTASSISNSIRCRGLSDNDVKAI